jgi:nucleoside-triphosphatase THEP1
MPTLVSSSPIIAVVYANSALAALVLDRAASALEDAGHACAGLLQRDEPRQGRSRCDMILVDLASGERVKMSEDRGPGARGCHLQSDVLLSAMARVRDALSNDTSILVLNKFGKSEGEGGGLRPLIADALERGVPVLIAVPWRNIEGWREFAGAFAREVEAEAVASVFGEQLLVQLGLITDVAAGCNLPSANKAK